METLDLTAILEMRAPKLLARIPASLWKPALGALRRLLALRQVEQYLFDLSPFRNDAFVDEVFELLDVSFAVTQRDLNRIPAEGPLIVVANHPLGALDSLALLRMIRTVRPEARIVANDVLVLLEPIREMLIPVNNMTGSGGRRTVEFITSALADHQAIVLFPAGEVSRLRPTGIVDGPWQRSAVRLAQKHRATVLPVHIEARNSVWFYLASTLWKPLGTMLLPRELFRQRGANFRIKIGNPIPAHAFDRLNATEATERLRKQVYAIPSGRATELPTQEPLPRAMDVRAIREELGRAQLLGLLPDGKQAYVTTAERTPGLLREVGRLREATFRSVREGTGKRIDMDAFDRWYDHLVLWDDERLSIVGAYRLAPCGKLTTPWSVDRLYTADAFHMSLTFRRLLPESLELGRSFLQQTYWNTNALEYLWQSIGTYLSYHPRVRYLFGTVSLSDSYPAEAKEKIVGYYQTWFGAPKGLVKAKTPYVMTREAQGRNEAFFVGQDHREDFRLLKAWLRERGLVVPTLFRQYVELCEVGGARFLDFAIDESFGGCVDGFIMLDLWTMTRDKRERYLDRNRLSMAGAAPRAETFVEVPASISAPIL
ncbi:MAG: lysophospholipid acyltransferase family protein [Bacteroidetes bacterium]|jgi:putative hemolysin|nr:lysophospholipid acyltransferase family protein [Bacteroidota bacterium]